MPQPFENAMQTSAQKQPALWRIAVCCIIAFGVVAIATPIALAIVGNIEPQLQSIDEDAAGQITLGVSPGGLFCILSSFALLLGATLIGAKSLHGRNMRHLTGPAARLRQDGWSVLKWSALFAGLTMLLPASGPEMTFSPQLSFPTWVLWLPFGVIALLIQVTAEEVFFRGYLQTQLSASFRSHKTGLILSALIFGLGHMSFGQDGFAVFIPAIWAVLFGLVAGDLTARTGTLGPAIAIHFVNNALAIFIAPVSGQLSGFGLWVRNIDLQDAYSDPTLMVIEALSLLVMWLIARIALKR
jgi:membrane protease YdiL (CAAX protease family)